MINNKKGFTFVELIVSIVIISILTTIGFSSYIGYISDARDTERKSDLLQLSSSLDMYKQKRGYYGNPGDFFNITYSGTTIALQGKLNKNVHIDSIEKLPFDPKNNIPYSFSVTKNRQEFELVSTLENGDNYKAFLVGNYKSVSRNILPTITLATGALLGTNIEIQSGTTNGDNNRKLFIYSQNFHNLIYTFDFPFKPFSDNKLTYNELLVDAENNNNFWQSSDYRNCTKIIEAKKMLIEAASYEIEYQIVDENGLLSNTGCMNSN